MFDFLGEWNAAIKGRTDTLLRNIRSASNSFYDAYLDAVEEIAKDVAENKLDIDLSGRTGGYAIRNEEVADYLRKEAGVAPETLTKISDYILKINKHKHHREKNVSADTALNYMRVYFDLAASYARANGVPVKEEYDGAAMVSLFGQSERENAKLRSDLKALASELESEKMASHEQVEKYKALLDSESLQKMDLEGQNAELQRQIILLKDMKLDILDKKLDKANDMLLNLSAYLVESRAVSIAALNSIVGEERADAYLERARQKVKNG
ncbi:MAG: hypothetical protein K6F32_01090 [Bacilli bacterium]|nr:hypothetical protein [Bacilli bacterium]